MLPFFNTVWESFPDCIKAEPALLFFLEQTDPASVPVRTKSLLFKLNKERRSGKLGFKKAKTAVEAAV